jgi:hypothetical protein
VAVNELRGPASGQKNVRDGDSGFTQLEEEFFERGQQLTETMEIDEDAWTWAEL